MEQISRRMERKIWRSSAKRSGMVTGQGKGFGSTFGLDLTVEVVGCIAVGRVATRLCQTIQKGYS
jgi:hypothetical protein